MVFTMIKMKIKLKGQNDFNILTIKSNEELDNFATKVNSGAIENYEVLE